MNMVSSHVDYLGIAKIGQPTDVLLMTTVVDVIGRDQERHRVRVFFDQGSQASFVSTNLVNQVSAQKLRDTHVTIQGFGTVSESRTVGVFQLDLIDRLGTHHRIAALQKSDMNLCIPPVPYPLVQRWRNRGVEISDPVGSKDDSQDIQILIGADYMNKFLLEKREIDGEVAWLSSFGWVLSGPSTVVRSNTDSHETVQVTFIQSQIETLWELEEPISDKKILPVFPLQKSDSRYEVGLLWKNESRPLDNKKQGTAQAIALRNKLVRDGTLRNYERVLVDEYLELGAIEREYSDQEGYYMPHHAVVRVIFNNKNQSSLQRISFQQRKRFIE